MGKSRRSVEAIARKHAKYQDKLRSLAGTPCHAWERGKCDFGDKCQFKHGLSSTPITVESQQMPESKAQPQLELPPRQQVSDYMEQALPTTTYH